MYEYLLNATAIWLISLISYDVFLRRESYHSYNRFYLLFTFFLGALLPLSQLQADMPLMTSGLQQPVERVAATRQNIVESGSTMMLNWQSLLWAIYIAGVAIALLALLWEVGKLLRLYRIGKRSASGHWLIIETGREHTPFSFRNMLFVTGKAQYADDEWAMLLAHEGRHSSLIHFADLLVMQLARVLLWFHPMVYMYNKRLLLVHEYQADDVPAQQPQKYGRFLVQQALLGTAPVIAHSFNRSPIKKRIIMLSHRSSSLAKSKMLVFLPVAVICLLFFTKYGFSQQFTQHGNKIAYRGNSFELSKPGIDTFTLIDPVTGKEMIKYVQVQPKPISMNGRKIYTNNELTTPPQPYATDGLMEDHLLKGLTKELDQMPNGTYALDIYYIVFDEKGKVVFYKTDGLHNANDYNDKAKNVPEGLKKAINKKVDQLLHDAPAVQPGTLKGKNVISKSEISLSNYKITVKDHKTTISGTSGMRSQAID
jgi:BlaR1 peptidase M56